MANTTKIQVVVKTPGKHIEYAVSGGKKITFGDDELTINLASRERDYEVSLDICIDEENGVVIDCDYTVPDFVQKTLLFLQNEGGRSALNNVSSQENAEGGQSDA